ncbi:MAG: hypothetical protein O2877_01040 [bacterium]|nr:hypothetical protein [bacterium]
MEALYEELDREREHTVDKPSESLRDNVYEIAKKRIIVASKEGDVVFDGTGSSFRFDNFYEALKEKCSSCHLVYVDARRDVAFARTQERDIAAHRPFDREYFDRIYEECGKRKEEADFVIHNDGSRDEFIASFNTWLSSVQD